MTVQGRMDLSLTRECRRRGTRGFSSRVLKLDHGGSALVYTSGRVVIMGCRKPNVTTSHEIGVKLNCTPLDQLEIKNYVFSGKLNGKPNMTVTVSQLDAAGWLVSYEGELFPAMFVKNTRNNATFQLFPSGKYVITGIHSQGCGKDLFNQIRPLICLRGE